MRLLQADAGPLRRRGRARVAAATLGVAVALAACSDSTGPISRDSAPDELEFSIGGFSVGERIVELRGDTVVLRRWSADSPNDSVRAVPTPDSWRGFWEAARRAGIHRWRSRYAAEGVVDGLGWGLRIAADGQLVQSSGNNSYPDRFGREHELYMSDDFRAFLTAVGELVGQSLEF